MVSTVGLINAGLRGAIFVWTVISLGIEGHLRASRYHTARVNLGVASSVIGLVFSVFIPWGLLFFESVTTFYVAFVLDFISFALYLSAAAALTQQRHICHDPGRGKCGEFRAGIAFLYLDWIFVLFVMIVEVYQIFTESRYGGSGFGGRGGYGSRAGGYNYNSRAQPGLQTGPSSAPVTPLSAPAKEQPAGYADQAAAQV